MAKLKTKYIHATCGKTTTLTDEVASQVASAARDLKIVKNGKALDAMFCAHCKKRFASTEFTWDDGTPIKP